MKKNILIIIAIAIGIIVILGIAFLFYRDLAKDAEAGNVVQYEQNTSGAKQETSAGAAASETNPSSESASTLNPAADFTFYDTDGNECKLSDYFGKPIILNFWASWCGPCRAEMPYFNAAYEKYSDKIVFLIVNLTDGVREKKEDADKFVSDMKFDFPIYYDQDGEGSAVYSLYYIPDTYFINSDGTISAYVEGSISEANLAKCIEGILQ